MPRKKAPAPTRVSCGESSMGNLRGKRRRKSQITVNRRKVVPVINPEAQLLGKEPLRCVWSNLEPSCPAALIWKYDESGEIEIYADQTRIYPALPILQLVLEQKRTLYEIFYHSSSDHEIFLEIGIHNLPWRNSLALASIINDAEYPEYETTFEESSGDTAWKEFFLELKNFQVSHERANIADYQHPYLVPQLRGYQADAVQWMLSREQQGKTPLVMDWLSEISELVPVRGGNPLIYNKYSKSIDCELEKVYVSSGGILADEMGLGKTVITIALILKNRRPPLPSNIIVKDDQMDTTSSSPCDNEDIEEEWLPSNEITEEKEECKQNYKRSERKRKKPLFLEEYSYDIDDNQDHNYLSRKKKGKDDSDICSASVLKRKVNFVNDDSDDDTPLSEHLNESDNSSLNNTLSAKELNQENCLNTYEQLVIAPCSGKNSNIRTKLQNWYENVLSEVNVSPKITRERQSISFRCVCGDDLNRIPRNAIRCPECELYQHPSCVGYTKKAAYLCPACWKNADPIATTATLIIVPPSIFQQWNNEIKRHAPKLKVLLYSGVSPTNVLQPIELAEKDIVITTYPVLSAETTYTESVCDRPLRQSRRYLQLSTPLTCISWWRVVCDEAQLVESDASRVSLMVQKLNSVHKWSVTGTPIQRGIADLYYLTQFMGLGPLDIKYNWTNYLLTPYFAGCKKPLLSVLNQVFWRSTKDSVIDELGLPEQTFQLHNLKFSAIEETFYMQEHMKCSGKFSDVLQRFGFALTRTLPSLDKSSLLSILQPMLNLRQACLHPQVVNGIRIATEKGASNLSDLLKYLSKKTKLECEDSLRKHVSALNGIAGLRCIREEWNEAIDLYRTVLKMEVEYQGKVKVDTLQRIHATYNAASIVENHNITTHTLRDSSLPKEVEDLEKNYKAKAEANFNNSLEQVRTFAEEIKDIENKFESSPDAWWGHLTLQLREFERELVEKVQTDLETNDPAEKFSIRLFLYKLNSIRAIEVTVGQWWSAIVKYREKVISAFNATTAVAIPVLVDAAVECHLRTKALGSVNNGCDLCKVEKMMLNLECELFNTVKKQLKRRTSSEEYQKIMDGSTTKGSWKPNNVEKTLLIILNLARSKQLVEPWCFNDSKAHAKMLDLMKKEFKQIRAAWTELNHLVQAEDEIAMCKLRLRLPVLDEEPEVTSALSLTQPNKNETLHIIDPYQVDGMMLELECEAKSCLSMFNKKHGQMVYLQNLEQKRNSVPDPCPICTSPIEDRWCVLQCGHCYCITCIQQMCAKCVKCPVCREITDKNGLCFVDTTMRADTKQTLVVSDYSTKVDAIVGTALELLKDDPAVKILIFSSWIEVLKILEEALRKNSVKALILSSGKHQVNIQNFRDPSKQISVLLLPYSWGSKGLNLIEATHVFLAEPILTPAEELQAIGRVHRIGQTKPTIVHRFIVQGTIEEKILQVVGNDKSNKVLTLGDLQEFFVIPTC